MLALWQRVEVITHSNPDDRVWRKRKEKRAARMSPKDNVKRAGVVWIGWQSWSGILKSLSSNKAELHHFWIFSFGNSYKSFDSSSSMSFARLIWHRQQIHYFQVKQKWEILLEAIVSEWWGLCQDGWGEIRGGAAFRGKLRQIFEKVLAVQLSIFHDSVLKFCRMT